MSRPTSTTFSTGPKRAEDPDGPGEYHVILLDNGRSSMLGTEFQDMLRCIRCGACMNHCPVYQAIGGHAYGAVYPGPIGAVLTQVAEGRKEDINRAVKAAKNAFESGPWHDMKPAERAKRLHSPSIRFSNE